MISGQDEFIVAFVLYSSIHVDLGKSRTQVESHTARDTMKIVVLDLTSVFNTAPRQVYAMM